MNARLSDKVAIVTGSGQGIGKGIALRLAAEGATVVVAEFNEDTARATVSEIEAEGGCAPGLPDRHQRRSCHRSHDFRGNVRIRPYRHPGK